ncbi:MULTISPECIES: hypothetical protein [Reichenbachiella]|uniref:Uncharacterized protein n=1 Tax=Reichenbachiella agariperforans TaxID=156994 RepID=A0A1M6UZG1_REIAG|nr:MULTISPECIES: hypothetical protein [Reichenbachiella]MBU2912413.1 hypothetical protein [Reichenbachiella agariperforans]RJE72716.1 hypothetical protein BGP76_01765 [Reichenbachiella sp. MSK19-1]SHK74495.1 hypothetical protein SAMN04488028_10856 [Reichenbachiella agariperforans]
MEEYHIGGNYKLKLSSKKLKSGKCQVKFHASLEQKKNMYGYVLADSGETLTNVVQKIYMRLDQIQHNGNTHHINLYSIGRACNNDNGIIMFEA